MSELDQNEHFYSKWAILLKMSSFSPNEQCSSSKMNLPKLSVLPKMSRFAQSVSLLKMSEFVKASLKNRFALNEAGYMTTYQTSEAGVTISLRMGVQGRPTPIDTPTPQHTQTYAKSI